MNLPYTVLVLRPDYITDDYGQDTFLAHVESQTPLGAQKAAQQVVAAIDEDDAPQNYFVLAVFEGHLNDVKEPV